MWHTLPFGSGRGEVKADGAREETEVTVDMVDEVLEGDLIVGCGSRRNGG